LLAQQEHYLRAKVAQLARRGAEFGVMLRSIKIEMPGFASPKIEGTTGSEIRLHREL